MHLRVTVHDQVCGAIGIVAGEGAVDVQVAVHQYQKRRTGHACVAGAVRQVKQPLPQRATLGQGGIEVQRGPLQIARDPQRRLVGEGRRVLRHALGHPAVGGNAVGYIGQRAKSGSGHGAGGMKPAEIVHPALQRFGFALTMMCCLTN